MCHYTVKGNSSQFSIKVCLDLEVALRCQERSKVASCSSAAGWSETTGDVHATSVASEV